MRPVRDAADKAAGTLGDLIVSSGQAYPRVTALAVKRRGKIVIISSIVSEFAFGAPAYSTAKAGVNHFGEILANELSPHHINVNVIRPGWIDTPGERKYASEEQIRRGGGKLPWRRMGRPEEIARAIAELPSQERSAEWARQTGLSRATMYRWLQELAQIDAIEFEN